MPAWTFGCSVRLLPGYGDDPRYAPLLLLNLGHLEFNARQFAVAGDHMRRALHLTESTADQHTAAYLHHGLGEIAFQEGLYEAAETHAAQALESARQLGDPLRQAYALDLLASIKAVLGDGSAGRLWSEAQRLSEEIGHALADDIREFLANPAAGLSERRFVVNKLP
jgi:tetratricopeptide (TPR) repeat protein